MAKRSWKDTYTGGFLKAADLPREGKRVKITSIDEEVVSKGERPKLIATLKGLDQRWVLNATNCELLEDITGSENPDDWCGPEVEIFNDRTVRGPNGEKGGIRVREAGKAAKKGAAKSKKAEEEDEQPFDADADLDELEEDED